MIRETGLGVNFGLHRDLALQVILGKLLKLLLTFYIAEACKVQNANMILW